MPADLRLVGPDDFTGQPDVLPDHVEQFRAQRQRRIDQVRSVAPPDRLAAVIVEVQVLPDQGRTGGVAFLGEDLPQDSAGDAEAAALP